jgi:hypothetical protein
MGNDMIAARYVAAAMVTLSIPVSAQTRPEDVIVGDWRISQEIPATCQVITQASDRLIFTAVIHQKTRRAFVVLDGNIWNLDEGQQLTGEVSWDNWKTSIPMSFTAATLMRGMTIRAEVGTFPVPENGEPNHISIRIPEIYLAADFPIGDSRAVPAIERCLA